MIKKVSHIIFALLILASTAGMTISEHYCGDILKNISLLHVDDPCCDNPDCCHNESETFVIEDSFSITTFDYEFIIFATIVPSIVDQYQDSLFDEDVVLSWLEAPPPPEIKILLAKSQSFLL